MRLNYFRIMMRDITAALIVLAVFFVMLGGASSANPPPLGYSTTSDAGWCGDQAKGDQHHAPCHACRADAVTLPPAPCVSERISVISSIFFDLSPGSTEPGRSIRGSNTPRAPPAIG